MQHILALTCVFLLTTSSLASSPTRERCQFSIDSAKQSAKAVSEFTLKLYQKIVATKLNENTVFSPVSISLALALLSNGATGVTRSEIQRYLSPPGSNQQDSSPLYESLQRQLQIRGDKAKLNIANGFFYADGRITVKQPFVDKLKQCFETKIDKVAFSSNPQEARRQINQWVSNATEQKIPELFKTMEANVVAVLANALYFKAAWVDRFTKTENLPFYKLGKSDQTQSVPFMTQEEDYSYKETDKLQIVELPYDGAPLSMYILLPKQRDGIKNVENALSGEELRTLLSGTGTQLRKVTLKLPKFTIRTSTGLTTILKQLGINKIFSDNAEFTNIAESGLQVSDAVHEAYIKINENGTEAAAATGFKMVPVSAQPPTQPVSFVADHPFIFAIVHKATNAIVFFGKVNFVE